MGMGTFQIQDPPLISLPLAMEVGALPAKKKPSTNYPSFALVTYAIMGHFSDHHRFFFRGHPIVGYDRFSVLDSIL